ncbi:hypothetical protein [Devosia aurantiaca]|uniref:Uncharacterized protein n=1 Tax=Devosia aurantiaca TaxID=2714858 RepID=A0A6M1SFB6_9HYPH|nr:hypothetical protein [Devosia aurantiaca]NGP18207.1 hypothetical protein [Devosia aurantiaca]
MHSSTSSRRKSFKLVAVLGTTSVALGSAVALFAGVSPAQAANIASQADTQVAVFMVPLTLLVLVLLFEVARFALRGRIPVEVQPRRQRRPEWTPRRGG